MFNDQELELISDVMTTYYQSMKSSLIREKHDDLLRGFYEQKMNLAHDILEHIYSRIKR